MDRAPSTSNLVSIQAIRGIAALGVVLFHLLPFEEKYLSGTAIVPAWFAAGRAGVDMFFVLSGFFFTWTTIRSPGGGLEARRFLLRRLTRIYPTYWFICSLLIVVYLANPSRFPVDLDVLGSLMLLPTGRPTLLLVSWTLVFEVYFYIGFAIVLWAGRTIRWRLLTLMLWFACVIALRTLFEPERAEVTLDLISSPLVLEFFAGCLAGFIGTWALSSDLPRWFWFMLLSSGILATACSFVWASSLFVHPWWRVAVFGASVALLLIGCLGNDTGLRGLLPRSLIRLGDASYSLYLSHLLTIGMVGMVWHRFSSNGSAVNHAAALIAAVIASIMVSIVAHLAIEKPLLRGIRGLGNHAVRIGRLVTT